MFSNSADQLQQPSDGIPVQQPKASDSSIGRPSSLLDPELRDVHYSHAGDFSQQWMPVDRCGVLADVCEIRTLDAAPSVQQLRGNNTLLDMTQHGVGSVAMQLQELLHVREAGTRVTVLARACDEARLLEMGFENVPGIGMYSDAGSTRTRGILVMSAGQRSWAARAFTLSYEVARTHMDPRDQEGYEYNPEAKQAASWREMPWVPELWESVDLPPELSNAMCNGVQIKMGVGAIPAQMEQYAWPTGEALMHCVIETNRALHVGSMEYVPDDEVQHVLDTGIVHPWTVAMKPKPRACQDYSGGTNVWAHTAPFGLTNVWQAVKVVGPDSFFYKNDLRDGFWFVPVATRNLLVMRHPATGRLIRCNRLPFGFVDSPRIFCSLTEAIAQMLRARIAGWGAHVFCYCDDFLIIGKNYETTKRAGAEFECLLAELGIEWAPHKQRGPCKCIEFLGLLLCNAPGMQCVSITQGRAEKLLQLIDDWRQRKPLPCGGSGAADLKVTPREVAVLMGNLVFVSQVVPGGRTYMQCMLSSFKGLEVDWRRGKVKWTQRVGKWFDLQLRPGFWRDLEWWHAHLLLRNCKPMAAERPADAWIAGTDSSNWGTGQLIWRDGQRAEVSLRFGLSEARRSINWRELLGIYRILQAYATEFAGQTLLIETDNTSAKGAASKMASSAEDMQELIRRLFELAERWNIALKFVHTPGCVLHRPDQTSRGDPVEEPRIRLNKSTFDMVQSMVGSFTELCGAERRHMVAESTDVCASWGEVLRIWMHPTHTTVGSALRLLGERLRETDGHLISGAMVVPHDEAAGWWGLLKYFSVVGRWREGSSHLEMNRLGTWVSVSSKRPSLLLVFPRSLGAGVQPVVATARCTRAGYVTRRTDSIDAAYKVLAEGSFVYRMGPASTRGEVYLVWKPFDASGAKCSVMEDGEPAVLGAQLLKINEKGSSLRNEYALDRRAGPVGSFAAGRSTPWALGASTVWCINSFVTTTGSSRLISRGNPNLGVRTAQLEQLRFTCDYMAVETAIVAEQQRGVRLEERAIEAGLSQDVMRASRPLTRNAAQAVQLLTSSVQSTQDQVSIEDNAEVQADSGEVVELCEALDAAELDAESSTQRLASALEVANEAAAVRKPTKPSQGEVSGHKPKVQTVSKSAWQLNRYTDTVCGACERKIGWGKQMLPAGRAFACSTTCAGVIHVNQMQATDVMTTTRRAGKLTDDGYILRRATLFAHRLGSDRVSIILQCLDGKCFGRKEARSLCIRGCGRGIHMVECCMLSTGFKSLGQVVCSYCRVEMMTGVGCSQEEAKLEGATKAMIVEMSSGADSTAQGFSEFVRLEKEWVMSVMGEDMRPDMVHLPHSNEESFYNFVVWLCTDAERAKSLVSIMRNAGSYMTKLEFKDWTKSPRIKTVIREMAHKSGVSKSPATQVTGLILNLMVMRTITNRCKQRNSHKSVGAMQIEVYFVAKALVTMAMEVVGGCRIGESTGARHGVAMNDLCIQALREGDGAELGETIEGFLEDSKTGDSRHIVFVGKTRGPAALEPAKYLRQLWKSTGVAVDRVNEAGFDVWRPDYWVVRVSILDMPDAIFDGFVNALSYACEPVAVLAKGSESYARSKRQAASLGEHEKFVNICGGRKMSQEIKLAVEWMHAKGWSRFVDVVKGPLIRATRGYTITHMPLSTDSADLQLLDALWAAQAEIEKDGFVDPELDVEPGGKPRFSQHSFRRYADRRAALTASTTGATSEDINFFFGWRLKELKAEMQKWYAGLDRRSRLMRLARVTMML